MDFVRHREDTTDGFVAACLLRHARGHCIICIMTDGVEADSRLDWVRTGANKDRTAIDADHSHISTIWLR